MTSNTFRIQIATDVHLGYKEDDEIRGNDSFAAFQEVLNVCQQVQPDILLLGGDLLNTINPSQTCLYKCLTMLQNIILGDRELDFSLLNSQANFLNQNLNINLPIFTIHGNHDVPMQSGALSVCDLLHASNYVNYFGKYLNTDQIHVTPLIFQKNTTIVALYGIGYIHPFRMSRLFEEKKITFENPPSDSYNIIVVHQNRYKGKTMGADFEQCLHPKQLPQWIDLIIWCHEHDSHPQFVFEQNRKVYQPGSTIPTSLTEGQSIVKHTGLLQITGRQCKLTPYFLQKVYRPIVIVSIDVDLFDTSLQSVEKKIIKSVEKQIEERVQNYTRNLPLVRVKIDYSEKSQRTKIGDLEEYFKNKVANRGDVFKLKKKQNRKNYQTREEEFDLKTMKSNRLQHYKDLHQEFGKILDQTLGKESYTVMKYPELKQIISVQLTNLLEKGRSSKSVQTYVDQSEGRLKSSIVNQISQFNKMMQLKYTSTTSFYKNVLDKNLSYKPRQSGTQMKLQQNQIQQGNLLKAVEYESMWQMKINQMNTLDFTAYANSDPINSALNIKQEYTQHHHHDQQQKCCPKGNLEFQPRTQNDFIQIDQVVRNQKKPKQKKQKPKKYEKKQQRSRSRSKSKGFL